MAKIKTILKYECTICGEEYDTEKEALQCESMPISHDKGVRVGEKVLITAGDGSGKQATVVKTFVLSKNWGHYAWKRYWHTIALEAKIIDDYGHRMLTFDSYKTI